jgi:hypothetical protein
MTNREHTLSVKLSPEEIAKAHALADADDASIGQVVRRWIRESYAARFGEAAPPTVTLRPGPGRRRRPK